MNVVEAIVHACEHLPPEKAASAIACTLKDIRVSPVFRAGDAGDCVITHPDHAAAYLCRDGRMTTIQTPTEEV